jgi:hypothetical protein
MLILQRLERYTNLASGCSGNYNLEGAYSLIIPSLFHGRSRENNSGEIQYHLCYVYFSLKKKKLDNYSFCNLVIIY